MLKHKFFLSLYVLAALTVCAPAEAAHSGRFSQTQIQRLMCPDCREEGLSPDFAGRLLKLQAAYGRRLVFTSGYRCERHNAKVGGVPHSAHRTGNACDVAMLRKDQAMFARIGRRLGFVVLCYPKRNYCHVMIGW